MPQENQKSNVLSNVLGVFIGAFATIFISLPILYLFNGSLISSLNLLFIVQLILLISSILVIYYKKNKSKLLSFVLFAIFAQALSSIVLFQLLTRLTGYL